MTQDEILKGNKLIAEFMGHKMENNVSFLENGKYIKRDAYYIPEHQYLSEDNQFDLDCIYTPQTMKYHTSGDWLMPVLLKVGTIATFTIDSTLEWNSTGYDCRYQIKIRDKAGKDIAIQDQSDFYQASWLAAIEYIKWYNEQSK